MKSEDISWYDTEHGKQQLLDIINGKFAFMQNGRIIPREEFCEECKNEHVACVCMDED